MITRALTDADWPVFAAFIEQHFGQSHNTARAFNEHWFRTSRHDGWAVRLLEGPGRTIVGALTAIVVPAWFGGREVPLAWISNGAVEDDVRARGGGARLILWAYQTFPLVGALSGNEFSRPLHDRLGISVPGLHMRRFIRIHDKRAADLCQSANRDVVRAAARPLTKRSPNGLQSRLLDAVPAEYGPLWERFRRNLRCTTNRHQEYMTWRYSQAPCLTYRILAMRSQGVLRAVTALRFQMTPVGLVCRVLDFIADEVWAEQGWREVIEIAQGEGSLFTDFMVIGACQDEFLRRAGFLTADAATGLDAVPHLLSPVEHRRWTNTFHLGGPLAKSDVSWRRAEAVYFTKGDGDRDWPTTYGLRHCSSTKR